MKLLSLIGILLSLNGCIRGTDTGNPAQPTPGNPMDAFPSDAMASLVSQVCGLLSQCNSGLTRDTCADALMKDSTLGSGFGLVAEQYPNVEAAIAAERAGTLKPHPSALNQCMIELGKLTCSDNAVIQAYRPDLPAPFEKVAGMIPDQSGNCAGVF